MKYYSLCAPYKSIQLKYLNGYHVHFIDSGGQDIFLTNLSKKGVKKKLGPLWQGTYFIQKYALIIGLNVIIVATCNLLLLGVRVVS